MEVNKDSIQKVNEVEIPEDEVFWCSWCFFCVPQELLKHSYLFRNTYRCTHCFRLTLHCLKCSKGMAKKFMSYSDKFCSSCDGSIPKWDEKKENNKMPIPKDLLITEKWCSWCFSKGDHILLQKNFVRRNLYQCQSCSKQTLTCFKCSVAMTRGSEADQDRSCSKCDNTIKDWEEAKAEQENKILKRVGWCSWCFDKTDHIIDRRNRVKRNVYNCEACSLRTLPCMMCEEGMTRGGPSWDDSICSQCTRETGKGGWTELKERKDSLLKQLRNKERIEAELQRQSKYRTAAVEAGLLRPFLLLVAMPAIFRNQVACFLGWTIFTEDFFGDPQAESWHILSCTGKGMQTRCNHSYEKINPFINGCNWYDILVRVAKIGFQKDISSDISSKKTTIMCNDSKDPFILGIEEKYLLELSKLIKSTMTEEQRQKFDEETKSGNEEAKAVFIQRTGITTTEVARYAYNLVNKMLSLSSQATSILISEASKLLLTTGVGTTIVTSIIAPLSIQLGLLATPLFFLGIFGLAKTGFNLAFGSTEGRLFIPVTLILNQRILIAAEGLRIEDYY